MTRKSIFDSILDKAVIPGVNCPVVNGSKPILRATNLVDTDITSWNTEPIPPFSSESGVGTSYNSDVVNRNPEWPPPEQMTRIQLYGSLRYTAPKKRKKRLRKKIEKSIITRTAGVWWSMAFNWILSDEEYETIRKGIMKRRAAEYDAIRKGIVKICKRVKMQ
jgi:hypothetical protein